MDDKQKEELFNQRKIYFEIKKEVINIFEPRLFELMKENSNNVRNTIIICTTLATINILILDSIDFNYILSSISIICFVLSVLLYSIYLMKIVGGSIENTKATLDRQIDLSDRGQEIIEKALTKEISFEQMKKDQYELFNEVKLSFGKDEKEKTKKELLLINLCAKVANSMFAIGIVLIFINLLLYLFC